MFYVRKPRLLVCLESTEADDTANFSYRTFASLPMTYARSSQPELPRSRIGTVTDELQTVFFPDVVSLFERRNLLACWGSAWASTPSLGVFNVLLGVWCCFDSFFFGFVTRHFVLTGSLSFVVTAKKKKKGGRIGSHFVRVAWPDLSRKRLLTVKF